MKRLYISPDAYITLSEKTDSLSAEIATRRRAVDFYGLGMYLPDPDPVLRKQGKDIKIYRQLLIDPHVWACVQSRKSGVLSLEWEIDRGKARSRPARFIRDVFDNLDIYRILSEILDAVLWGYQPMEVLWERQGNYILPRDVVAKPPEWFVFSEENELRFRSKGNWNGIPLPERKFLLPRYNASYNNPYGERTLSRVFWPVTFKKGGMKFWVIFTEKYGMPFLVGRHPRGAKKEEIDALADMLEAMIQDAVAVIPDDSSVELKDFGGRNASAQIYQELINVCNSEISKAILGQTLTTEIGNKGSYAASQTHFRVRADLIEADRRLAENTMNQLIRWIYEINFGDAADSVPEFIMWQEEDVDKDLAERDKALSEVFARTGLKFSKTYFRKNYGFDEDDLEPAPAQGGEFAEATEEQFPDQTLIDAALNRLKPEALQRQAEAALQPVMELIRNGTDYREVMEKLAELYPNMNTDELEETLARAIFVAEMWGRVNGSEAQ